MLVEIATEIPVMIRGCEEVEQDLKETLESLKKLNNPEAVIAHLE